MPFSIRIPGLVSALLSAAVSASPQEVLVSSRGSGAIVAVSGTGGRVFAETGELSAPSGITFGSDGSFYVVASESGRVLRFDAASGALVGTYIEDTRLRGAGKIGFGPDGGFYAAAPATHQVLRFDAESADFDRVAAGGEELDGPRSFTFDADGRLYVSSFGNNAVLTYDGATGEFLGVFASAGLAGPSDLAFGPDGYLYVSSAFTGQVLRFDGGSGAFRDVFVSDPSMGEAAGLAWDRDEGFYVASSASDELRRYDAVTGASTHVYSGSDAATLQTPRYVVPDRRDGSIRLARVELGASASLGLTIAVTGATPGGRVAVLIGTPAGETTIRECPGVRLLDIDVVQADVRVSDGSGGVVRFGLPPALESAREVSVQAVDLHTCTASAVAALVRR